MWSTITPDGTLWRMCKILRVQRNPLWPIQGERGMIQKHPLITSCSRLCQTSEQRGAKKHPEQERWRDCQALFASGGPFHKLVLESVRSGRYHKQDDKTAARPSGHQCRAVIQTHPAEVEDC
jgi:hypothetical protein